MSAGRIGPDVESAEPLPAPVVEVVVDESLRRALVGVDAGRIRLRLSVEDVTPSTGGPATPDELSTQVRTFVNSQAPKHAGLHRDVAAVLLQRDLLDAFGVKMGDKAIAVFMHAAWTSDLAALHGPAAAPSTLRRWRREPRRGPRS